MTFFPQHFLGLRGMPRRYSDFSDAYLFWNVVSSFGSLISLVGTLYLVFVVWEGVVRGRELVGYVVMTRFVEWGQAIPPEEHTFDQGGVLIV